MDINDILIKNEINSREKDLILESLREYAFRHIDYLNDYTKQIDDNTKDKYIYKLKLIKEILNKLDKDKYDV